LNASGVGSQPACEAQCVLENHTRAMWLKRASSALLPLNAVPGALSRAGNPVVVTGLL
jgi:hypothetical protein